MTTSLPFLIDPNDGPVDPAVARALLQEFAANSVYRSADVEELILDHDFFRRALRPDDLDFIDFSTPLDAASASSLSALATHRMLLCINDSLRLQLCRPGQERWTEFLNFYSSRNRTLAGIIRPFLEFHAFSAIETHTEAPAADAGLFLDSVPKLESARAEVESGLAGIAASGDGFARRIQMVQHFGLGEERRSALMMVIGGWLTQIPGAAQAARALLDSAATDASAGEAMVGAPVAAHSCWQFYLPGPASVANLYHYLSSRPRNVFRALGALMFYCIAEQAFLRQNPKCARVQLEPRINTEHIRDVIAPLAERFGPPVWEEAAAGMDICSRAQQIADKDLAAQMTWINAANEYRRIADAIQTRIDVGKVQIDRETFVEPREMCSTTHVHDDHRLVVIENGDMVFWASPGMRICLAPGEKILVPRHRLHGSSVLSENCVYHQPIIPESWIQEYTRGAASSS